MYRKITILIAFCAIAQAKPGVESPPPKVHTYNVPSVAKVSYPGPQVSKSVETYSAPSIEKTTTITRSITAPLNAPNVQSVQYSAPAAPVIAAPVAAAPVAAYGAPVGYGYGGPGFVGGYAAPGYVGGYAAGPAIGYAAGPAVGYAAGPVKAYTQPTLSLGSPAVGPSLAAYSPAAQGGIGYGTLYSAPSLGYSLGGPAAVYAGPAPIAAVPAVAYKAAAPVLTKYGPPSKY